jgi:IS30 family transposase
MKKKNSPLNLRERIEIEIKYRDGYSLRDIAKELKRNVSTIFREIAGKNRRGVKKYKADVSHRKALKRIKNRGNTFKLEKCEDLKEYVIAKLKIGWSPEQISGRIKEDFSKNKEMRISSEAIYQYIYAQIHRNGNGTVKKGCEDLRMYLPRKRKRRIKKGARMTQRITRRENLPVIEDRPKIVNKRKEIGHWEDDFVLAQKIKPCIKTVNELVSGVYLIGKTTGKTAAEGDKVLFENLKKIPKKYLKTLTRDNGSENKNYKNVEKKLGLNVYFANPYHSWERGANENANGLLRRFFPKGTDWSKVSDKELFRAEYLINNRPRKRLNWKTPVEVFREKTGVDIYKSVATIV